MKPFTRFRLEARMMFTPMNMSTDTWYGESTPTWARTVIRASRTKSPMVIKCFCMGRPA